MLTDKLHNYKTYLVSQSPRRRELLAGMGIEFEVMKTDVVENFDPCWSPVQVVEYLSQLKLSPIDLSRYPENSLFITCDTIVVIDGKIIGKPKHEAEALEMVRALSGRTHQVYSGLTVATPRKSLTDHRMTEVTFSELSEEEIRHYVRQYRPLDKAGAYGVQEWIGYIGITQLHGSFYNVMGLPTRLLWQMLKEVTENPL